MIFYKIVQYAIFIFTNLSGLKYISKVSSCELPFCPILPDAAQNIKNADGGIMLFCRFSLPPIPHKYKKVLSNSFFSLPVFNLLRISEFQKKANTNIFRLCFFVAGFSLIIWTPIHIFSHLPKFCTTCKKWDNFRIAFSKMYLKHRNYLKILISTKGLSPLYSLPSCKVPVPLHHHISTASASPQLFTNVPYR